MSHPGFPSLFIALVPTNFTSVAGIKFRISLYLQKTIKLMMVLALQPFLTSLNKSSGVMGPGLAPPPEDDNDLLGFIDVQGHVVGFAPIHQMFHLLSVGHAAVLKDEAHNCCVICKLHNVVSSGPGTAVMGHQGEQQCTQDAVLRGAGAQGEDTVGVVAYPHRLVSVGEEVRQPVTQGSAEAKGGQFAHQMLRDDGIECQAEVQKQH